MSIARNVQSRLDQLREILFLEGKDLSILLEGEEIEGGWRRTILRNGGYAIEVWVASLVTLYDLEEPAVNIVEEKIPSGVRWRIIPFLAFAGTSVPPEELWGKYAGHPSMLRALLAERQAERARESQHVR